MKFRLVVEERVNWICEGIDLLRSAYLYKGKFNKKEFCLIDNSENFNVSKEEMNKEFDDVLMFQREALSAANKLYRKENIWNVFMERKEENQDSHYMTSFSKAAGVMNLEELTYEEFMLMNFRVFFEIFFEKTEVDEELILLSEGRYKNSVFTPTKVEYRLEDILELIMLTSYPDEVKFAMIKLYSKPELYYKEFLDLLSKSISIVKKYYYLIEKRREEKKEYYKSEEGFHRLQALFHMVNFEESFKNATVHKDGEGVIYVSLLGVQYNTAMLNGSLIKNSEEDFSIYLGIIIEELNNYSKTGKLSKEKMMEWAKAVGDYTRFEILEILRERPYFVKELADKLKMSSASLSHHLNLLNSSGFLKFYVEERKVFYELNREVLKSLGEYYLEMAKED